MAFTGKAQWVFGDGGGNSKLGIASRNTANIQMLEKVDTTGLYNIFLGENFWIYAKFDSFSTVPR